MVVLAGLQRNKQEVSLPREQYKIHKKLIIISILFLVLEQGISTCLSSRFFSFVGLLSRVFVNGPGERGSVPGRVIPKTQKMVLDSPLLNTQHY